jgi:hypothetical protein
MYGQILASLVGKLIDAYYDAKRAKAERAEMEENKYIWHMDWGLGVIYALAHVNGAEDMIQLKKGDRFTMSGHYRRRGLIAWLFRRPRPLQVFELTREYGTRKGSIMTYKRVK